MLIEQAPATAAAVPSRNGYGSSASLSWRSDRSCDSARHALAFTRAEITHALEEATGRKVVIRTFRKTYLPPGCVAEDVRVLHRSAPDAPPLISNPGTLQSAAVTWECSGRRSTSARCRSAACTCKSRRRAKDGKAPAGFPCSRTGGGGKSLVIDRIAADGARSNSCRDEPGKNPYRIDVRKLTLSGVGSDIAVEL